MQPRYRNTPRRRSPGLLPLAGLALAAAAAVAWWTQKRQQVDTDAQASRRLALDDYAPGHAGSPLEPPMATIVAGADKMVTRAPLSI